jgi:hypothetical protein
MKLDKENILSDDFLWKNCIMDAPSEVSVEQKWS